MNGSEMDILVNGRRAERELAPGEGAMAEAGRRMVRELELFLSFALKHGDVREWRVGRRQARVEAPGKDAVVMA